MGNRNAATPGSLYSKFLDPLEVAFFSAEISEDDKKAALEQELKLGQIMVKRAFDVAGKDPELLSKALLALTRIREAHRRLSGDSAAGIVGSLTAILEEFGIGADN